MPKSKRPPKWNRAKWEKEQQAKRDRKAEMDAYWSQEKSSRLKVDYTDAQLAKHERAVAKRARKAAKTKRIHARGVPHSWLARLSPSWLRGTRIERERASKARRRELDHKRRTMRLGAPHIEHETPMPIDGRCPHCRVLMVGKFPEPNAPTVDHIVPLARGGHHAPGNTQMICWLCNSTKGDRPLSYLLKKLARSAEGDALYRCIHAIVTEIQKNYIYQHFTLITSVGS